MLWGHYFTVRVHNIHQGWCVLTLTEFSVSDAHVAFQEVVHFLHCLLLKFCRLEKHKTTQTQSFGFLVLLHFCCRYVLTPQ